MGRFFISIKVVALTSTVSFCFFHVRAQSSGTSSSSYHSVPQPVQTPGTGAGDPGGWVMGQQGLP